MSKVEKIVIKKGSYCEKEVKSIIKLSPKQKLEIQKDLIDYAEKFLHDNYNMKLGVPIEIDGRLTRSGGSFHSTRGRVSLKIKMSERFIGCALLDPEEGILAILDVLKHELIHYVCCELGLNYSDGDYDFEKELAKHNIGASGATNKKKVLSKKKNIWYSIQDMYQSPIHYDGKEFFVKHTTKQEYWYGLRTGYRVIKTYF